MVNKVIIPAETLYIKSSLVAINIASAEPIPALNINKRLALFSFSPILI